MPSSHPVLRRATFAAALALLALLAIEQWRRVGDFRVDDAYITFSFSKNLAAGHGPVYSHDLRVEGYSNFLWMVLCALGYLVAPNLDPYVPARVFALLLLGWGLWTTYRLTRLAAPPWAALLAVGLVLASTDVMRATLSGLETVPYMSALAFGWLAYLREPPNERRWSLLAFLPAALLRIDGFVPMLVCVAFEAVSAFLGRRLSFGRLARWAAPAAGVWLAYFAWRYWYYGLPLPTTYYAKSMVDALEPGRGENQIWAFARDYGLLAIAPLLLLPLVRGPRRPSFALAVAIAAQLAYVASVGGDWMPFHRFFLPIVPLGAALAGFGIARLVEEVWAYRVEVRAAALALGLSGLAFAAIHSHSGRIETPDERAKLVEVRHVARHTRVNLLDNVDLVRHIVRRPGEKLATDYAGVFAVYTDATIIDMWGLCNNEIALKGGITGVNPIYGKECAACYRTIQPDYFHVSVPIARRPTTFRYTRQVIQATFQGPAIDHVIQLDPNYAVGRVVEEASGRTVWFLERRRAAFPLSERRPAPGVRVDYPFG